jgi:hypothetical protein
MQIELIPIQSSRIAAIGHDSDSFTLAIKFPPTKKAPAGKIYHYPNVSEEMFDDFKNAESVGIYFGQQILNNPDHPCVCVDEGTDEQKPADVAATQTTTLQAKPEVYLPSVAVPESAEVPALPEDDDGLKLRAIEVKEQSAALAIRTTEACEEASRRVMLIREERKLATQRPKEIKEQMHKAWKLANDFFNEIDSYYAEAERYLDNGIIQFRKVERERAQAEAARLRREEDQRLAEARRKQQEEHQRLQAEANVRAQEQARLLAEQDAAAAEAQGVPAEVVEQIKANPLPVAIETVAPPPLEFQPSAAVVQQHNVPKVAGLSFTTEWFYEITDESLIPLSHEFYSLDLKKINGRVQDLKKHANIPGVRVDSREVPRKRTGTR